MKKIAILSLLLMLCVSNLLGAEPADSLFRVNKIKSKGNFYLIEAERNDSLFLILSKKEKLPKDTNLEKIKKGEFYCFDLSTPTYIHFPDSIVMPIVFLNYLHIKGQIVDNKGTVIEYSEKYHYQIYTTKNLIGLYYSPLVPQI